MIDEALAYAAAGFPVIPLHEVSDGVCSCGNRDCRSGGKHPRISNGAHGATEDEATIRDWFSRWPNANIGINLSGLVAIDIDPRNGGDVEQQFRDHPEFFRSAHSKTGGGGAHILFRDDTNQKYPASIGPGLDVKAGLGSYIVIAPSIHASGQPYAWADGSDPRGHEPGSLISPVPPWLARLSGQRTAPPRDAERVPEGSRNNHLASLAGTMRRPGFSREAIESALLEENRKRCDPPLPDAEVRLIASSVARYDPAVMPAFARIRDIPSVWQFDAKVTWLIDGIVQENGVTLLCGAAGVGKSTFALALVAAVVEGRPFLGRDTQKRTVLYCDRENPLAVVRERLTRFGIDETRDLIYWGAWNDPAADGPTAPSILEFAEQEKPLIVFDSLVGFHPGSEQDATETRRHMRAYMTLRPRGASVLILHHSGKSDNSKNYRGSSDLPAAVDIAFVMENMGDPSAGISTMRLKPFKARAVVPETFNIEYVDGQFQMSNHRASTNREIMERIIREHPGTSKADIESLAVVSGVGQKRAREILDQGLREGWIDLEKVGRRRLVRLARVEEGVF